MNQKDFGLRLKALRLNHNLTQSQLAEIIETSRQAYSNYEQGRTSPPSEILARLSIVLDTDLFSFFVTPADKQLICSHPSTTNLNQEEFFSFLNLYTQLPVISRNHILSLMKLMGKGGDTN